MAKPSLQGAVPVPVPVTNPGIRRVAPQSAAVAPRANPVTARNLAGNLAANLVEKPSTLALIKKPVVLTDRVPLRTPVPGKPGLTTPSTGTTSDRKVPPATTRPPATARPACMQPAVDSTANPQSNLQSNLQPNLRPSDMRLSANADQRLGDSNVRPQEAASPALWALAIIVLLAAAGVAWAMLGSNGGAGW